MDRETSSMKRKNDDESLLSLTSKKPHNDSDLSGIKAVAESTKIGEEELDDSVLVSDVMTLQQISVNEKGEDEPNETTVERVVTICNAMETDENSWREEMALLKRELKCKEQEIKLMKMKNAQLYQEVYDLEQEKENNKIKMKMYKLTILKLNRIVNVEPKEPKEGEEEKSEN